MEIALTLDLPKYPFHSVNVTILMEDVSNALTDIIYKMANVLLFRFFVGIMIWIQVIVFLVTLHFSICRKENVFNWWVLWKVVLNMKDHSVANVGNNITFWLTVALGLTNSVQNSTTIERNVRLVQEVKSLLEQIVNDLWI